MFKSNIRELMDKKTKQFVCFQKKLSYRIPQFFVQLRMIP